MINSTENVTQQSFSKNCSPPLRLIHLKEESFASILSLEFPVNGEFRWNDLTHIFANANDGGTRKEKRKSSAMNASFRRCQIIHDAVSTWRFRWIDVDGGSQSQGNRNLVISELLLIVRRIEAWHRPFPYFARAIYTRPY